MTEKETLIEEIKHLQAISSGISATISRLDNRLSEILSFEFIAEHGVTLDKIERGSWNGDPAMPFFSDWDEFRQWLKRKENDKKPFIEWNGTVYLAEPFINGNLGRSCRLKDVKE
jgi:hypothetical protein